MEAASWDPPTIMFMSRRHDLRSEASTRFERGVDPALADLANMRASALVAEISGGKVLAGSVDVLSAPIEPVALELTSADVNRVLGPGFDDDLVASCLGRLGMVVEGREPMRVSVPTYRPDITRPIDLVEEVARVHGYDRFEATLPTGPSGGLSPSQRRLRRLVAVLTGAGLDQAINLPFVGVDDLDKLGSGVDPADLLTVRNPLREEESKLRPSLLPGLLGNVTYNLSHGAKAVAMFEVGSVFRREPASWDARLPDQPERLAWAVFGGFGAGAIGVEPPGADAGVSLAIWRLLGDSLGIEHRLDPASPPGWHPGRTAVVTIDGVEVGFVGELAPSAARRLEIPGRVAIAEVDIAPLVGEGASRATLSPSVFPHVEFDLSFLVAEALVAADLLAATRQAGEDLVEESHVFDEFRDESLGAGKRALAIRYRLRAPDRTLTAADIGRIRSAMVEAAAGLGAALRGQ
jgi:phenylalanyl-tRNA synthetase beta chain